VPRAVCVERLTGTDAASFGDEADEDESVLKAGSLQMRKENAKIWQLGRKAWKDLWVVLKDDGCLYYYSSRQKVTTPNQPTPHQPTHAWNSCLRSASWRAFSH
jgi:hypothetical protein